MVTIRYTAWRLMREAGLNVILGSYNQRLGDKFSRKIKRIVAQSASFSLSSATDEAGGKSKKQAKACTLNTASEWETAGGGVVRSVGVGGGIAGFGAGLVVIDDPVRNRADAESEVFRDRVWDWFNDDIYTRLEPNAAIILIQTRWHEDDLAGRLLKEIEDGGEEWEVVCLPALAEERLETGDERRETGKEMADNEHLVVKSDRPVSLLYSVFCLPIRSVASRERLCALSDMTTRLWRGLRETGSYSFSALYQQQPAPAEGGRFKREWFREDRGRGSTEFALETGLRPRGFDADLGRLYGDVSVR